MTKFSLCKARNVFRQLFNEPAKKVGGVRWGVAYEMNKQVNRTYLGRMWNEYVMHCHQRNWSTIRPTKLIRGEVVIRIVYLCVVRWVQSNHLMLPR